MIENIITDKLNSNLPFSYMEHELIFNILYLKFQKEYNTNSASK